MTGEVVNCHNNHVARKHHCDADVWVTRKGLINEAMAKQADLVETVHTLEQMVRVKRG